MSGMIDRFLGEHGRSNRIEAMLGQAIVGGNANLAMELAERAELLAVRENIALIEQDGDDDDLYLILAGSFSIVVNGRRVAGRGRGEQIGEMAMIEPTQRRSATVVAEEEAVVAKVSSAVFTELGSRYPEMYRHLAKTLARRLRERNKFVGRYRDKIRVFIISSVEALPVARIVQNSFEHDPILSVLWTDGVFRVTSYALDALEAAVEDSDFAIAVAHGDDVTQFRGQDWPVPRDNVVFELGMFMGRLGRQRAILMEPREDKVRLPSDLSGITTILYRYEKGKDANALMAPACDRLRIHLLDLGPVNG